MQHLLGVGKVLASLGSARIPAAAPLVLSDALAPFSHSFPSTADRPEGLLQCNKEKSHSQVWWELIISFLVPSWKISPFHGQEEPGTECESLDVTPLSLALSSPEITVGTIGQDLHFLVHLSLSGVSV